MKPLYLHSLSFQYWLWSPLSSPVHQNPYDLTAEENKIDNGRLVDDEKRKKTGAWPVYCDRPIQRGQIKIRLGGGMNNLMRPFLNRPVFSSTAGWDLAQ